MAKTRFQKLLDRLRNKYRVVLLNEETFEEKLSFRLSRLNVFVLTGVLSVFLITLTTVLIAFTGLREFIPGYPSTELRRKTLGLSIKTDSLAQQLAYHQTYLEALKKMINGEIDTAMPSNPAALGSGQAVSTAKSSKDSLFRLQVEAEERFAVPQNTKDEKNIPNFFLPMQGMVTSEFDPRKNHFGIDVAGRENEPVKACLDGTILLADWSPELGHMLVIQHRADYISVYKHNSAILKKAGDVVRSGEVIAIVGNSGELSTGPHLHFELWQAGSAVNPRNFIPFQ
jgi:murein DD-endopeptidase MepM/ murein hydrolase activator NlpD